MEDRFDRLERLVREQGRRIERLEETVRSRVPAEGSSGPDATAADGGDPSPEDWAIGRSVEALVERHRLVLLTGLLSLALAGATILRMLAISDAVPLAAGAGLGLVYCGILMIVAERRLRHGAILHGDAFAILAILILATLLIEVTHRSGGLSREAAYVALAAALGLFAFVALRRDRAVPFGLGLLTAVVAGVAIGGRPFLHPYFAALLLLAMGIGQAGMRWRGWEKPRWGPGLASLGYLPVLGFLAAETVRKDLPQHAYARPGFALTIMAAIFLAHAVPALTEAFLRRRRLDAYAITMTVGSALIGFGAASRVLANMRDGNLLAGPLAVGLGLVFYAAAAAVALRRRSEVRASYALGAIALPYSLYGAGILLTWGTALGATYQALALVLALLAPRLGRRSFSIQAYVLTIASFLVLVTAAVDLGPPEGPADLPGPHAVWLLVAGAMGAAVFARLRSRGASEFPILLLVVSAVEILAGVVPLLAGPASALLGLPATPASLLWPTLQTLALVAGATGLLVAGMRLEWTGVTVLAVVLMALAAAKLFVYDAFRVEGTFVVVSSVSLGLALILSSFLYRRHRGLGRT